MICPLTYGSVDWSQEILNPYVVISDATRFVGVDGAIVSGYNVPGIDVDPAGLLYKPPDEVAYVSVEDDVCASV